MHEDSVLLLQEVAQEVEDAEALTPEVLALAKRHGFSDVQIALHDPGGLDIPDLLARRNASGFLPSDVSGSVRIVNEKEFIRLPCDVLAPCAISMAVHSRNAEEIRARRLTSGSRMLC